MTRHAPKWCGASRRECRFEQNISPRDNQRDVYEVIGTRTVITIILLEFETAQAA
jgi:hypothetical protein